MRDGRARGGRRAGRRDGAPGDGRAGDRRARALADAAGAAGGVRGRAERRNGTVADESTRGRSRGARHGHVRPRTGRLERGLPGR